MKTMLDAVTFHVRPFAHGAVARTGEIAVGLVGGFELGPPVGADSVQTVAVEPKAGAFAMRTVAEACAPPVLTMRTQRDLPSVVF